MRIKHLLLILVFLLLYFALVDLSVNKFLMAKAETKQPKTTKSQPTKSVGKNLVIVESPAKAKTIKKFLGNGYEVRASMGHISDLPKKKLGIDIEKDFLPTYEVSAEKKKVVSELKTLKKSYNQVWLATDEDREGEAIAWHILRVLDLDEKTTPRIVFHEITKEAITNAINNSRTIDMNLVNAQQGRRLLDRLVGFLISPVLWKKINKGLSAGRVQSVAVKLIVERERQIQDFKPVESWKLKAQLTYKKSVFMIELEKLNSKLAKLKDFNDVEKVLTEIGFSKNDFEETKDKKTGYLIYMSKKSIKFILKESETKDVKKSPSAPFITSSLQQEASRRFGRGVKQVMSVAQKLYENGYITYMRTDSVNLSSLAINSAKEYIESTYGKEYAKTRQYKGKSANAQEAHEAIRPTYIGKDPSSVGLSGQEAKLYSLIWMRTVASQMADAILESTVYKFNPEQTEKQLWSTKGQVVKFPGFMKLYQKSDDSEEEGLEDQDEENKTLPKIEIGTSISSDFIISNQTFSKPPVRYTEATLVKKLESEGIGRPSTYAPTISTIQDRQYIIKEGKYLKPTDIAFTVNDFLEKYFINLMDYKFTASMEQKLDEISTGKVKWNKMLADFYKDFTKELEAAGGGEKEKIFVGKTCPQCGGQLVYKFSKTGKFIGCDNFPDCTYTTIPQEKEDYLGKLKEKYEGKPCPAGGDIVVRMGRFGPFLTSSKYPEVKRIASIPDEKMIDLQEKFGGKPCEKCGKGIMNVKKSRKGYFLACDKYPECKNTLNIKIEKQSDQGDEKQSQE